MRAHAAACAACGEKVRAREALDGRHAEYCGAAGAMPAQLAAAVNFLA